MKIILAGGSGQLGTLLATKFQARKDEVVVLSRTPAAAPWRTLVWDGKNQGPWARELDGADVVINLAGRSVNCRYSEKNQRLILESRVDSARAIAAAVQAANHRPPVWLQMSTATIYAHRFDAPNDELSGQIGGHELDAPAKWSFSIQVAQAWESAATAHVPPDTRLVLLRTAMVMTPDRGGVFDMLQKLARCGLGGPVGDGRQYISWIHGEDFVRAIDWLIANETVTGPVNLSSPFPLPQRKFMHELRRVIGVPFGLPATSWMLAAAAFFMRTETELLLKSRRVVPGVLLKGGFTFQYPSWPDGARQLMNSPICSG